MKRRLIKLSLATALALNFSMAITGCSDNTITNPPTNKPKPKLYNLKFGINGDGQAVSKFDRVFKSRGLKILENDFKLTNEILAEQNITLYLSEIGLKKNVLLFEANLTKGLDENNESFFYLSDYIDGNQIDLTKPILAEITFDLNGEGEEKFYGKTILENLVNQDGDLTKSIIIFKIERLNIDNPPAVTVIDSFKANNQYNTTYLDIAFDNVFRSRNIKSMSSVPEFSIKATNSNAEILIKYFNEFNSSTQSIFGKVAENTELISSKNILNLRLNLDRADVSEWIDGKSTFKLQIENQTYNFDIMTNGKNIAFDFQFKPYIQGFEDETFSYDRKLHKITVSGNDLDGENANLRYEFSSSSFLIDQNGSENVTLTGAERGVVKVVTIDEQDNHSKVFKLIIGSFTGVQQCINNQLGLDSDATPTTTQLNSITDLSCIGSAIDSLEGIEKLKNLKSLDFSSNGVTDLEPLAKL